MTDEHDELDPAAEAAVRRLVADARATEPMPAPVAARLDAVIGDLAAERADQVADVVPLVRRRRRASLLLAAAAVVVGGVAVGQYAVDGGSDAEDAGGSVAGAPAERAESGDTLASDLQETRPESEAQGADQDENDESSGVVTKQPALLRIRSSHLADDLVTARLAAADGAVSFRTPSFPPGRPCPDAPWGPGQLVAVLFQQAPAVAAFRPATEQTQVVDLLQCGTAEVLRSATLPAP